MWTRDAPPAVAGEERVEVLGPGARDEAEAFLTEHSPRTHGQPFARPGQRWVAVRDPHTGALVAVGGSEPSAAGTPTLAGIAVETGRRGAGWGAAVTAHLTRLAVAEVGACALGMFADNDVARAALPAAGVRAPGWSGPAAGSGREPCALVWNRPPTAKGQRCPRSATVPSTSTSRTAVVTAAPSSSSTAGRSAAPRGPGRCPPSPTPATGSSRTTAVASARATSPATPRPTTTTRSTGDLDAVLTGLDLRDVTLVGFSMGGGEVARYLGTHGADRVHSAVFAAAIPPCLKLDGDHPDGALDDDTVSGMQGGLEADPPGFLDGFTRNFFSADGELKVTEEQQQEALGLALQADVHAAARVHPLVGHRLHRRPGQGHRADPRHPRRLRRDRADREVGPAHARTGGRQRAARHRGRPARHQRLARRGVQPRAAGVPRTRPSGLAVSRSRRACSPRWAPRGRASCRSCPGRAPRCRRAASPGGWRNSTPLADSSSKVFWQSSTLSPMPCIPPSSWERRIASTISGASGGPGHGQVDLELRLGGVDDGAPAVPVAEGDVVLLLEAEDIGVELLRLVLVLDEDADDADVRDHGSSVGASPAPVLLPDCGPCDASGRRVSARPHMKTKHPGMWGAPAA